MIDWVNFQFALPHLPIKAGAVFSMTPEGEVEWSVVKRTMVRGSHDANISVRSVGAMDGGLCEFLSISGNPSKFLQGHNLFGSDDLVSLCVDVVRRVADALGLQVPTAVYEMLRAGDFTVSMVDINYSFELRNQADVMAWIHAAEFKSRNRAGRSTTHPGTIYWGKNSRHHAIKAYSKANEINNGPKKQRLPTTLDPDVYRMLHEWAENKLRIELRLLKRELSKLKLTKAADLAKHIRALFNHYLEKIKMSGQLPIAAEMLLELPRKVHSTYTLWLQGYNMREMLTNGTFYRHMRQLLEYGIDISITCDRQESSNVVPFVRVLEAKPAEAPAWAFNYPGLIHRSAA